MSSQNRLSRRTFLAAIGKLAGTSVMFKAAAAIGLSTGLSGCGSSNAAETAPTNPETPAPNPTPPTANPFPLPQDWPTDAGSGQTVVILGAGIAGMTAAWEMQKLGYQCTILEATQRAGGRCRTIRQGDVIEEFDSVQQCDFDNDPSLYFNVGPARIAHHHALLLGYCREFEVALEPFINVNNAAFYHSPFAFGGAPQTARQIMADSRGHISALLASAINQSALDQTLSTAEKAQMLQVLQGFGDLRGDLAYRGSLRSGFDGIENNDGSNRGQQLDPIELSNLLQSDFWVEHLNFGEGIDQQPTMLQPVGGMDNIAKAFEQRVGQLIEYQAIVNRIDTSNSQVTVNYINSAGVTQSISADYCICTIPAPVLSGIDNNFSNAHRSAIDTFVYTQACKVAFQSARFWETDHGIYGGISWSNQTITQMWYPSSGFGKQQGIVVGAYTFSNQAGSAFANMVPSQRLATAITEGNQLHGQYGQNVTHGISISWPKMPFQQGAWGVSTPGTLLLGDGNCYFAGEHLSILQGWQEGAILSAYHAIDLIVSRNSTV